MLIYTELFSNVSGLGLEKNFGPRPRPHSFWPRPRVQLASLTSLLFGVRPSVCLSVCAVLFLHSTLWFEFAGGHTCGQHLCCDPGIGRHRLVCHSSANLQTRQKLLYLLSDEMSVILHYCKQMFTRIGIEQFSLYVIHNSVLF